LGFYLSSSKLTQVRFDLLNCTFNNNTAPNGGNLIFITGRSLPSRVRLYINGCRFYNGESKISGGGMYIAIKPHNKTAVSVEEKALSLSIINCNFTSNAARKGSAILISPITGSKRLEFFNAMLSGLIFRNNGPQNTVGCNSTIFLTESHSGVLHLNSTALRNQIVVSANFS